MKTAGLTPEQIIIGSMHKFVFHFDRDADSVLSHVGGSFAHFLALMAIKCCPDASQRSIVDFLALTPAAVSRIVDSLVEQDFVVREEDPENRRAHRVHLTASGEAALENLKGAVMPLVAERLGKLSEDDKTAFISLMTKLVDIRN